MLLRKRADTLDHLLTSLLQTLWAIDYLPTALLLIEFARHLTVFRLSICREKSIAIIAIRKGGV
ncbi:MAG: hypothetical protein KAQ85_01705 [Thermodesulfovibrionia bacterium]|nr:hypothetical protein [Thermodesulfovibrionia bacterium]